ncbi:MAG: cysteine hydrolase [Planctomycetes bacterium]|nr:cysteine hydrolase [Planctomycetota bacterium]
MTTRPVLMIIDMQNGFCHPAGSFSKFGFNVAAYRAVIPKVRELKEFSRSKRLPVYYSKAIREASGIDCLDKVHRILPASRRERIQKVPLCIRGTWDADIIDELRPEADDYIVEKRRDSVFQDTEVDLWLRALRLNTLILCGVDTYICVESTLRDAFNRGYDIVLAEDAVASTRPDLHRATIEGVRDAFGLAMPVAEVKRWMTEQAAPRRGAREPGLA